MKQKATIFRNNMENLKEEIKECVASTVRTHSNLVQELESFILELMNRYVDHIVDARMDDIFVKSMQRLQQKQDLTNEESLVKTYNACIKEEIHHRIQEYENIH